MKLQNSVLITITLVLLGVYNFFYWTSKKSNVFQSFHHAVTLHWRLITFLEFLAVASVIIDLIIRWDKFNQTQQRLRLFVTALVALLFMLQLVFGIIEMYMRGGVS